MNNRLTSLMLRILRLLLLRRLGFAALPLALSACATVQESPRPMPSQIALYEMRTYYAEPGKLDELNARFRDHTLKLFARHGMTSVAYWMPVENPERKLIYILGYRDRAAREAAWTAFRADPEWQAAAKASEANGKLVAKVESIFMRTTDYSPGPLFEGTAKR